jgi:hypothetical protein
LGEVLHDSINTGIEKLVVMCSAFSLGVTKKAVKFGQIGQIFVEIIVVLAKRLAVEPSCEHLTCPVVKIRKVDGEVTIFPNCTFVDQCLEKRQAFT